MTRFDFLDTRDGELTTIYAKDKASAWKKLAAEQKDSVALTRETFDVVSPEPGYRRLKLGRHELRLAKELRIKLTIR